ncbi:MAG: cell division protein ZapA [Luteimonas sp.]
MTASSEPVSVRVLDREYTVGVEPDERDSLMAAAKLLDAKMRDVRGANRMAAVDRVAVLAALNLAHELQQLRQDNKARDRELERTLGELQNKLDALLES